MNVQFHVYFLLINGVSDICSVRIISVNITEGDQEERMMMTGMHTVVDIFCVGCGSILGWKYVRFDSYQSFSASVFCSNAYNLVSFSGVCARERPEVQRREVHPWEVSVTLLLWFASNYYWDWNLLWSRGKVLGPDGSNYMGGQEAQAIGSDADDAWSAISPKYLSNCKFFSLVWFPCLFK